MLILKRPHDTHPQGGVEPRRNRPIIGLWGGGFEYPARNLVNGQTNGTKGAAIIDPRPYGRSAISDATNYVVAGQTLEGVAWAATGVQRTLVAFAKPTAFTGADSYPRLIAAQSGNFRMCGIKFGNGSGFGRIVWYVDATGGTTTLNSSGIQDTLSSWPWGLAALVLDGTAARGYWIPVGTQAANFPMEVQSGTWSGTVGGETVSVGASNRSGTPSAGSADILGAAVLGWAATPAELMEMASTQMGSLFEPARLYIPQGATAGGATFKAAWARRASQVIGAR